MLFTEFNMEDALMIREEEGREKGRQEGEQIGRKKGIMEVATSFLGLLDDEVIAEKTGLTLEDIQRLKNFS